MKERLDLRLVALGLAESRARAQVLIGDGAVEVNGELASKPAQKVDETADVCVTRNTLPYVSRAGLKLRHGLEYFDLDPSGVTALDLGASTGGFSEVLLEAGAGAVWAVDVGHGQLHPSLRDHERLHAIEGLNVRDLSADHVPVPDWIVADLSFISLQKALPPALDLARSGAILIALVKPQFEVGPGSIGKGGVVRDSPAIDGAREAVRDFLTDLKWRVIGECESPILGGDGNREFLIAAQKAG